MVTVDKAEARKQLRLDERPVVLSFGGSLGARKVNEAVADLIARSGKDKKYQHIHAYGKYGTWFPDLLKEKGYTTYKIRQEKLIGQGTLTAIKNGTGGLDAKTIARLCEVLDCQPGDLMEYVKEEN